MRSQSLAEVAAVKDLVTHCGHEVQLYLSKAADFPCYFSPLSSLTDCVRFSLTQGMDGPGMDGPAWKRQRMDDGPGGPSRQDSVFYKTRMCHKYGHSPTLHAPCVLSSIVKAIGHQKDISIAHRDCETSPMLYML